MCSGRRGKRRGGESRIAGGGQRAVDRILEPGSSSGVTTDHADPDLTAALKTVVDKLDATIRAGGYNGDPISMYIAGGLAVHYYSRARYTFDIDASFSHRLLLPYKG